MRTPIQELLAELRAGKPVIITDDENRENEGDLIAAAQLCTPATINFMATHGRGLICLALTEERVRYLALPPMVADNQSKLGTNFCVSIGARDGVTTGISAADRALTVALAVGTHTKPGDLVSPGHIFPLQARRGGVLERAGHTEAAVDLTRLAGLSPAGVICEVMRADGQMARGDDLQKFAASHNLKMGTIADLIAYRLQHERLIEKIPYSAASPVPGMALQAFKNSLSGAVHYALIKGEPSPDKIVTVRVHRVTVPQDLFAHAPDSLQAYTNAVASAPAGVLVLLTGDSAGDHETTSQDLRDYGIGAQILRQVGVKRMRVLTKRPLAIAALEGFGLELITEQGMAA